LPFFTPTLPFKSINLRKKKKNEREKEKEKKKGKRKGLTQHHHRPTRQSVPPRDPSTHVRPMAQR
jgi:hypothetical protein